MGEHVSHGKAAAREGRRSQQSQSVEGEGSNWQIRKEQVQGGARREKMPARGLAGSGARG